MSNHNHQHVSLQQEQTFNKGRMIFFVFSPFSVCREFSVPRILCAKNSLCAENSLCREFSVCRCSDARITVSHPASLRRRRTGWNRAPASCSWRRSRSWRRRWTGTWTGSAKQVRRADQPGQQLPFSSFEIENRFPDFFWPVESEGPRIGQNLSCTLSAPVSSFTSGQWWRTLALSNPLPRHRTNNGLGWLLVCFPRLSMTPRPA